MVRAAVVVVECRCNAQSCEWLFLMRCRSVYMSVPRARAKTIWVRPVRYAERLPVVSSQSVVASGLTRGDVQCKSKTPYHPLHGLDSESDRLRKNQKHS
jgi:hypothetical protein